MKRSVTSSGGFVLAVILLSFISGPVPADAQVPSFGIIHMNQSERTSAHLGGASLIQDAPGTLSRVVGGSSTSLTVSGGNGSTFPVTGTLQHASSHFGRTEGTTAAATAELSLSVPGMGLLTVTYCMEAHGSGGITGEDDESFELTGSEGYGRVSISVQGLNNEGNPATLLTRSVANSFPSGASATLSETVTLPVKLDGFLNIAIEGSSYVTAAAGLTASASAQVQLSFTIEPQPFIWTGAEGSAFSHGGNWEGGLAPEESDSVQLGNTASSILLDGARTHPGLSMPGGGDHIFILGGHSFGVGAEGVTVVGGRLTVSNGTLDAAGQATRVGSLADIPATLVISQGGAGTTFNTGTLLVGHTGDGEVQIGNSTVNVGTLLTLGATPDAKGTIRLDRGLLDVQGGAAIGIPPGSGSRLIAQNESVIFWSDSGVATFDHESAMEVRGEGTFSLGGGFVFRGGSRLLVESGAELRSAVAADAFILDSGTATFAANSAGQLGGVELKNDAILLMEDDASVTMESLTMAAAGDAILATDGQLTINGDRLSAAEAPGTAASISAGGGLLTINAGLVSLGAGLGSAEFFVSGEGVAQYPSTTEIRVRGGGGVPSSVKVVEGGKSTGGSYVFQDASSLVVDGLGSQFSADQVAIGALDPIDFDSVAGSFRNGSISAFDEATFGYGQFEISGGAIVMALALVLDGAEIVLKDTGSILAVDKTATVNAPSLFLSLGQGSIFEGGTLVLGNAASVIGTGALDFDSVTNNGLISPGFSPGVLTVDGDLHQAGGRIVLEIGGTVPGVTHDQIVITGDFDFTGGVIELVFTNGFAPRAGQSFELLVVTGEATGSPVVNVFGLEPGWEFELVRDPETGILKANSLTDGIALNSGTPGNLAPVAVDDTSTRLPGRPIKMSVEQILANDSDPDGDVLSLASVAAVSAKGVSIELADGWIFYAPAPEFNEPDNFTYSVSDGFGSSAEGQVFIIVQEEGNEPSRNILNAEVLGDGRVRIRFLGIPGRNYLIQAVESLGDTPWTTLDTQSAGSTGLLDFIDDEAALFPTRYYRTATP